MLFRYYNSWIETSDELVESESSSYTETYTKDSMTDKNVGLQGNFQRDSLGFIDDVEKFAPQVNPSSADFSISFEPSRTRSHGFHGSDSSSDEDEEAEDVFGLSFM